MYHKLAMYRLLNLQYADLECISYPSAVDYPTFTFIQSKSYMVTSHQLPSRQLCLN